MVGRRRWLSGGVVAGMLVAGCASTDSGVAVEPLATPAELVLAPAPPSPESLQLAGDKPAQDHDPYVVRALSDIEDFWRATYPSLADGEAFPELGGGVWPAWRTVGELPGCGEPLTRYADVEDNAFYCFDGDFIAFDDALLFPDLASRFGPPILGMVLAHEYGHAVQARLDVMLAPVTYELQADCFAGAWMGRLERGGSSLLALDNEGLRGALGGLLLFKDDPGVTSDQEGAHGSAFDRLAALQDGLDRGAATCAAYAETPPEPLQLPFLTAEDLQNEGNLPYDELLAADPADEGTSLPESLDLFWDNVASDRGTAAVALAPTLEARSGVCPDAPPAAIAAGVAYCPDSGGVVYDEAVTRRRHREIGDFSLGVAFADAWAAAFQRRIGIDPAAEGAERQRDCLTGSYVAAIFPVEENEIGFSISPGDLDEAVTMYLVLTEGGANDDARLALDRIRAFRAGLVRSLAEGPLAGVDGCLADGPP